LAHNSAIIPTFYDVTGIYGGVGIEGGVKHKKNQSEGKILV
jgi:hypothetical protein